MRLPDRATWLGLLLGGSGVLHLVRPRTYEWLVPPELGGARRWVTVTGVAEIGAAALLAAPVSRRAGGRVAAALLIAFVPAHLHTFRVIPKRRCRSRWPPSGCRCRCRSCRAAWRAGVTAGVAAG